MNIIYNIGIYMLTSSFIMVSYVWIRYKIHTRSAEYQQIAEAEDFTEKPQYTEKVLAA